MLQEDAMHEGSITIRLKAEIPEIERLSRIVRHFGELHELPLRALYCLNLAVDELVTNAVVHGFEDSAGEEILVRLEIQDGEVRGEVTDGGREFNPLSAATPDVEATLEERALGGLGIHLVRNLMDKLHYRRDTGKNVLSMARKIR